MLHRVNPHAIHAVLADDVVVVVSEGRVGGQHVEGGTWGGRHIQWVGGMYCEGAKGQAR